MPVAVITAHGNIETAVQALKLGAFDFISKPLDLNNLRNIVANAVKLGEDPATGHRSCSATPMYRTQDQKWWKRWTMVAIFR